MLDKEFMYKLVKIHLETGRTIQSIGDEYGVSSTSLRRYKRLYMDEVQKNDNAKELLKSMEENRKLKAEMEELKKENDFLKKAAAFFAKNQD